MRSLAALLLTAFPLVAGSAMAEPQLVMVEQPGCAYCAAWDDEIAPAYGNTAEGRFAPLLRAQLADGPPEGMAYDRPVRFTPTFVIVDDGQELGRIEGYPGAHFFFPLLETLLRETTEFEGGPT